MYSKMAPYLSLESICNLSGYKTDTAGCQVFFFALLFKKNIFNIVSLILLYKIDLPIVYLLASIVILNSIELTQV